MIDFLASVDPMTLPLWAVVLFAASMYPMGFLFGVCSECCCSANRCHFHECCGGYACRPLPEYDSIAIEIVIDGISYSIVDYETNWYRVGTKEVSFSIMHNGMERNIREIEYWYLANSHPVGNQCDPISGVECQYTIQFRAVLIYDGADSLPTVETETINWFSNGECAAKSDTISLGPFLWQSAGAAADEYLSVVAGSAFIEYDACKCGACCEAVVDDGPAGCSENIVQHLCNGDQQLWKGEGTTCNSVNCNSGACCTYEHTCTQVFSQDFCSGTYFDGVDCDPNPCV